MLTFMKNQDKEAHLAGIQAYNRWLKDGFCKPDSERLIGIFQTPNVGIDNDDIIDPLRVFDYRRRACHFADPRDHGFGREEHVDSIARRRHRWRASRRR